MFHHLVETVGRCDCKELQLPYILYHDEHCHLLIDLGFANPEIQILNQRSRVYVVVYFYLKCESPLWVKLEEGEPDFHLLMAIILAFWNGKNALY